MLLQIGAEVDFAHPAVRGTYALLGGVSNVDIDGKNTL
jgi:hypothetical protein